jgi:hypothetical protein
MKDLYKFENLNFNTHPNGGSKVFLEDQKYKRAICDVYGDKYNFDDMELQKKIHQTIRDYFKNKEELSE